jgi:DDE family transposase
LQVMRDGRRFTVEVTADGAGLVSHAGSALLAGVADRVGLSAALADELSGLRERNAGHDPGRVICDLAVMLADGGDCLADLRAVRDQVDLFGAVASDSTAFRVIDKIASTPGMLDALERAHATARERVWKLAGAPPEVTLDVDATLLASHCDKEGAAGNYKGGYGFYPILAYCDQTRESMAGMLRPGNAGANSAADQISVAQAALQQIPREHIETIRVLLRVDSAGACHELLDWAHTANIRFSVGLDLRENVREQILQIADAD